VTPERKKATRRRLKVLLLVQAVLISLTTFGPPVRWWFHCLSEADEHGRLSTVEALEREYYHDNLPALADYHKQMRKRYLHAMWRPWEPDPEAPNYLDH
jgi:hypothetical protein